MRRADLDHHLPSPFPLPLSRLSRSVRGIIECVGRVIACTIRIQRRAETDFSGTPPLPPPHLDSSTQPHLASASTSHPRRVTHARMDPNSFIQQSYQTDMLNVPAAGPSRSTSVAPDYQPIFDEFEAYPFSDDPNFKVSLFTRSGIMYTLYHSPVVRVGC